jgi:hypothetical protein
MQPDVRAAITGLSKLQPGGELEGAQIRRLGGDVRDWMAGMRRRAGAGGARAGTVGTGALGMQFGDIESSGMQKLAGGVAGIREGGLDRQADIFSRQGQLGLGGGGLQLGEKEHQRGLMSDQAREYAQQQQVAQNERELAVREAMNNAQLEAAKWGQNMDVLNMMSGWMS